MNLKGVLPPVYNALFETNGFQKVDRFLDLFLPGDPDAAAVRETLGNRVMSELSPKVLKPDPVLKQDTIWQKPVAFDTLSFEMQQALLDTDLQDVIREAEPDFDFDIKQPTLGLIARVPIIQQIAFVDQIGHAKKTQFLSCIDALNDEKTYRKVINETARKCPDFAPHVAAKPHYKFRLQTNPKNINKKAADIWGKSSLYPPTSYNVGKSGVLGVDDLIRIRIVPESDEDYTFEQYTDMRDQILAYMFTGNIAFKPTKVNDHVSNTIYKGGRSLVYPACNIHGLQDYDFPLKNKESVIARFSGEVQFVPLNSKIDYYSEATIEARKEERINTKLGIADQYNTLARYSMIEEMWTKMPHLYQSLLRQERDPSLDVAEQHVWATLQDEKTPSKKGGYASTVVVNLSGSDDPIELGADKLTKYVLDEMIQPHPNRPRHKLQKHAENVSTIVGPASALPLPKNLAPNF